METITWDRAMRERLRGAYNAAVKQNLDSFWFENHEFVTGYAKYLLQHLDAELGG